MRLDNAAHCPLLSQQISPGATYTVGWNKWDPWGTNFQFLKSVSLFLPFSVGFLGSGLLPPSWSAPRYLRYIVFNFCPCIRQSDWYFGRITRDRAQLEYARFFKQSAVHFYHLLKTLVGGHQFTLSLASFLPPLPYRMSESL